MSNSSCNYDRMSELAANSLVAGLIQQARSLQAVQEAASACSWVVLTALAGKANRTIKSPMRHDRNSQRPVRRGPHITGELARARGSTSGPHFDYHAGHRLSSLRQQLEQSLPNRYLCHQSHSNRVCTDFVYGVYLAICDEGASIMTVHASGRAQFTNTMNMRVYGRIPGHLQ